MATRKRGPDDDPSDAAQPRAARIKPNSWSSPGPIGNTTGLVVPETAPNPHFASAPAIKPTETEKGWWASWGSDVLHTGLDVVGLVPGFGEVADGANALIYLAEGDKVNAAISAAAMIPGLGAGATATKYGKKAAEMGAEALGKTAGREAAEAAGQKTAREAEEAAAKKSTDNGNPQGGNSKGNPRCILRPYKPDTCKAEGRTGHHVVPDRVFRTGARGSSHPFGVSEDDGLVICVDGANLNSSKEHGKIHKIYDQAERALGKAGKPPGTAPLGLLEATGALAVGKVTGCNPLLLEAQLRAYHELKGLGPGTIVRADPSGKLPIDFSNIGVGNTTPNLPRK
ncbi:hypothetical protein [Paracidovorax konjaci]|uniref:Uncharacterized protein n=1 Tax=Paracidovorax konjaci TaxID=32040 RepID=A0A1I1VE31_9BURK|nr:hypothetical protein [Paracidovorax konjaci]SFD81025.1 hypothetical protein SAMN04489710_106231 [Paracidovorax konjaci]